MILELLGLGMLGAIGKTIYDEGKKEQSQNNTIHNYQQQNNKQATPSYIPQSDLQGEIRQLELNSNIGSIIDDNGCIYDIIFTPNTFKGFPNNMPKVNDQVMFTKQSVNGRLYANNIRYLTTADDIFDCMRICENSHQSVQSEPAHDNTQDEYAVFNYIKRMSTKELLNAIASEYAHIKGTLNNAPAMGEYGSVEFAGALLIWKYCKEHLYGNKSKICGSLMINLGETIGCAYFGMPAGEWSNKMDMVINTNELLDYTEWNYIYNYLKENYIIYIHKFEFCNGICPETGQQAIYLAFVQRYNEFDTLSEVFMFYQSMGLNLKSDMPFTINE